MSVYTIITVDVTDPELYAEYVRRVPATVTRHGGRYLVRSNRTVSLAGDWRPQRVVLLEFPSLDRLREWWSSPEYQALAPIRERSTRAMALAVEDQSAPECYTALGLDPRYGEFEGMEVLA